MSEFTCELCKEQISIPVISDQNPNAVSSLICTSCLSAITDYDCIANIEFLWDDLKDEQKVQLFPYIKGTAKYGLWFAVFGQEDFNGTTFEEWLKAIDCEYSTWVNE